MEEPDGQTQLQKCIIQQEIFRIELTGAPLLLTIAAIIMSIQILRPSFSCILLILAPLPAIVYNDYANFINLGPGGTPPTFLGYLKISYLRLFALRDKYTPAEISDFPGERIHPETGHWEHRTRPWLPKRSGPRPTIAGIAPQRQLDQAGDYDAYQTLRTSMENLTIRYPHTFRIATSCFEKRGLALFARDPINATCRGEVCHVHHSDRSLHMNLHPDDARVVLENGWGERHPLAKGGWMAQYVPKEFVMVYAPRNAMELGVVCHIIEAAAFWVSGESLEMRIESEAIDERDYDRGVRNE